MEKLAVCDTNASIHTHTSGRQAAGNAFGDAWERILWCGSDPLGLNPLQTRRQNPTAPKTISSKATRVEAKSFIHSPQHKLGGQTSSRSQGPLPSVATALVQAGVISHLTCYNRLPAASSPSWSTGWVTCYQTAEERTHVLPPRSLFNLNL